MNEESYTPPEATPFPVVLNENSHFQQEAEEHMAHPTVVFPSRDHCLVIESHDPELAAQKEAALFSAELIGGLDHAVRIATDAPQLSAPEEHLLSQILDRLSSLRKNLVRRNFDLLAMHRCGIWRQHYESLAEFAKIHAGISSSQLRKILDETELIERFLRRGLHGICPTGQNAQLLLKVTDPDHHVEAWEYVRNACATEGLSRDRVRDALRDYCQKNQITFGRRKESDREFVRRTGGNCPVALPGTPNVPASPKPPPVLLHILQPTTLAKIETTYSRKDPCQVVLESLNEAFASDGATTKSDEVSELIVWLQNHDPAVHRRLVAWALESVSQELDRCVSERCRANAEEKARLQRRKQAQAEE